MSRESSRILFCAVVAAGIAGCGLAHGSDDAGSGAGDAGQSPDAGTFPETGPELDADLRVDAGRDVDGGHDAGSLDPYDPSRLSLCRAIESRVVTAVSSDGALLALRGSASTEIVGVADGRTRRVLIDSEGPAVVLGFTADATALVLVEGGELVRYDVATGGRSATPIEPSVGVVTGAVTDGAALVVASDASVRELSFDGSSRELVAAAGAAPFEIHLTLSGDVLLVATDSLSLVARADGRVLARVAAPVGEPFGTARVLDADVIAVARAARVVFYDASFALLGTHPIAVTALAGGGGRLAAITAGALAVYSYARSGGALRVDSLGTIAIDATGAAPVSLVGAGGVLAASAVSGALVTAREGDLAILGRRGGASVDATPGIALLAGHRVVLASGVLALDTLELETTFPDVASAVVGTADARHALRVVGASATLIDASLAMTTLPGLPGMTHVALAPDGGSVAATVQTDLYVLDLVSGRLATTPLAAAPLALALGVGGTRAFVGVPGSAGGSSLVSVDVASDALTPLLDDAFFFTPGALVASPDGSTVAVAGASGLLLLDLASGQARSAAASFGPSAFADGGRWVFSAGAGPLFAVAVDGHVAQVRIPLRAPANAIAAAPDGELVVVGDDTSLHVYCMPESSLHP